jgi:fatty acid synthase subunit alpha
LQIGPAPTLVGMSTRSLELGKIINLDLRLPRQLYWYGRDKQLIYYEREDVQVDLEPAAEHQAETRPAPVAESAPAPARQQTAAPVAALAVQAPMPSAQAVADAPLKALDFLRVVVAVKLKKKLAEIKPSDTIKALVAGKSALQNELLGDLEVC